MSKDVSSSSVLPDETFDVMFEQKILEFLDAARRKLGYSMEQWGRMAYPYLGDPRRKIQSYTGKGRNGAPKRLKVADMVRLTIALHHDPVHLFCTVFDISREHYERIREMSELRMAERVRAKKKRGRRKPDPQPSPQSTVSTALA